MASRLRLRAEQPLLPIGSRAGVCENAEGWQCRSTASATDGVNQLLTACLFPLVLFKKWFEWLTFTVETP